MTTSAVLDTPHVRLDAGDEIAVPLTVRNDSDVVEGYRFLVVGPTAEWALVDPPEVSLYPGSSTTATVRFHPPRTATLPAGEFGFGVQVVPTQHPEDTVVPEGVVEVLPFLETTAELVPRTTRGRRGARIEVAIDNRGNIPVTVVLTDSDPAEALDVDLRPEGLTVQPGRAQFSVGRVRPLVRLWRGSPVTHPYTVVVSPNQGPPVTLDGTFVQEALLPRWLGKALAALLVLALLLAGLWLLVLKPTIRTAAKDAVAPTAKLAAANAADAKKQAAQAGDAAKSAEGAAGAAAAAASSAGAKPSTLVVPFARRLQVTPAAGGNATATLPVAANQTVSVTDVVLENRQGDFGTITVSFGDQTMFDLALENFRDIDYHFVTPMTASAGTAPVIKVKCNVVGAPPGQTPAPTSCLTGVFLSGTFTSPNA